MVLIWGMFVLKQVNWASVLLMCLNPVDAKHEYGTYGPDSYSYFLSPGMFAIRADNEFVTQEDFMKAVRKVADSKKLESKLDYKPL